MADTEAEIKQFIQLNTLYQLLAMRGSPLLEAAETLPMIPDLLNY